MEFIIALGALGLVVGVCYVLAAPGGEQLSSRGLQFIGRILGTRRTRGIIALFISVIFVRDAIQVLLGKYNYPQLCDQGASRRAYCAFENWVAYVWGTKGVATVDSIIALLLLLLCGFDFAARRKTQAE